MNHNVGQTQLPLPASPSNEQQKRSTGEGLGSPPVRVFCERGELEGGQYPLQRRANRLDYGLNVRQHFAVGKAQHAVMMLLAQPLGSRGIVFPLLRV